MKRSEDELGRGSERVGVREEKRGREGGEGERERL